MEPDRAVPHDLPNVEAVLECLGGVPWLPLLPRVGGNPEARWDERLDLTTSGASSGDPSDHYPRRLPVL